MIDLSSLVIKPLDSELDLGAFSCGHKLLDKFLKDKAATEHAAYKVRVFVACAPGDKCPLGYYALTVTTLVGSEVSEAAASKFPKFNVPAIYLALIGVNKDHQSKGIGRLLMEDVLDRSLSIAENAGIWAVALDAVSEEVAKIYEGYGFERFVEGERKMYMALQTVRDAKVAAAQES